MNRWFLIDGVTVVNGGLFFLIVLFVVAIFFPHWLSMGSDQSTTTATAISNSAPQMLPIAAVQPTPRIGGNGPGMKSLQKAPQINFQGSVQQITEQPQSDGQLHVWLNTSPGMEQQISVAPGWFLQYLGCQLKHDTNMVVPQSIG